MDSSVSPKDEIWFVRMCHHISDAVYHYTLRNNPEERRSTSQWKTEITEGPRDF